MNELLEKLQSQYTTTTAQVLELQEKREALKNQIIAVKSAIELSNKGRMPEGD